MSVLDNNYHSLFGARWCCLSAGIAWRRATCCSCCWAQHRAIFYRQAGWLAGRKGRSPESSGGGFEFTLICAPPSSSSSPPWDPNTTVMMSMVSAPPPWAEADCAEQLGWQRQWSRIPGALGARRMTLTNNLIVWVAHRGTETIQVIHLEL